MSEKRGVRPCRECGVCWLPVTRYAPLDPGAPKINQFLP